MMIFLYSSNAIDEYATLKKAVAGTVEVAYIPRNMDPKLEAIVERMLDK